MRMSPNPRRWPRCSGGERSEPQRSRGRRRTRGSTGGSAQAWPGRGQTFEMVFDVAFVRERFEPVDLIDRVRTINGRAVLMDTFLHAQSLLGERTLLEAASSDLVHPGQMICQFQNLMIKRSYVPPGKNHLLLIPYFLFMGVFPQATEATTIAIEKANRPVVSFFGREMDLSHLERAHVEKVTLQAEILEVAVQGDFRAAATRYFGALAAFQRRWERVASSRIPSPII